MLLYTLPLFLLINSIFAASAIKVDPCSAGQNGKCQNAQSALECIKYKNMTHYNALKKLNNSAFFYSIPNSGAARYVAKKTDTEDSLAVVLSTTQQQILYSFSHSAPDCLKFLHQKQINTTQEPFVISDAAAPDLKVDDATGMIKAFKELSAQVQNALSTSNNVK